MLICPQCKFENPDSNKFCQSCGISLVVTICQNCHAEVSLDKQNCQECGTECGKTWWAIITQKTNLEAKSENVINTNDDYLDLQYRYKLLDPLPTSEIIAANQEIKVRVLDCQPYQASPLEAMIKHQSSTNTIPDIAKIYLDLSVHKHPGIPHLHDAWQDDHRDVLMLVDRSTWPLLLDVWQQEETSVLHILHWLYQMTQIWELLEMFNCQQSLLDLSNLRLDEDQTLALQRLYLEPIASESADNVEKGLNIQSLGRLWQTLFRQSERTQFGFIVQMLEDLETGKIDNFTELRSRLQSIATEMEEVALEAKSVAILLKNELEEDILAKQDDAPTMVLSMQLSNLEYSGCTDVGRQRDHNEDYFVIDSQIHTVELPGNRQIKARGLYILCDGMGGHAGGEIASKLAVDTIRTFFEEQWNNSELPTEETIKEAVYLANQAIYNLNQGESRSGIGRMGTTLVMLLLQDNQAAIVHIGDSRLYSLTRKRGLEQLTVDHEVGQREISRGVEPSIAYGRPDAYQLTQALGPRHQNYLHPDVTFLDISETMLFLLASDGLSDNDFLEVNWQDHLQGLLDSGTSLERGVQNLVELANEHNGHDNITAILVRVKVRPASQNFG